MHKHRKHLTANDTTLSQEEFSSIQQNKSKSPIRTGQQAN